MNQSEVEVGEAYGYAAYEHARQERVVLREKNIKGKDWRGRQVTLQRVERADGSTVDVPTRELRNPWAIEQAKRDRARDYRIQERATSKAAREEHAPLALRANDLLHALGVGDGSYRIDPERHETDEEIARDLADLGFHVYYNGEAWRSGYFVLAADESVVERARFGSGLKIPKDAVAPLVEAAEVFL